MVLLSASSVSRLLGGKEPKAKSLVDPFNRQKSSRYSSLVAVGLWLSFIGLNWTSFSWYAARINSLALSSCLALKYLRKYRVCLKYLDLSLHSLRVDFRSLKYSRYQLAHYHKRLRTLCSRKQSIIVCFIVFRWKFVHSFCRLSNASFKWLNNILITIK